MVSTEGGDSDLQHALPDCDRLVGSDALCGDIAGNVRQDISICIILVNRKGSRVTFSVAGHDDL